MEKIKGLIVMGDLPTWKKKGSHEKGSHCNGRPTQIEKKKGLIVISDLPRWKKKGSHYNRWPAQEKDLIVMGDLLKWKKKGGG
jgi:hypothetical protein